VSGRGHYRTSIGASTHAKAFVHTLELKQRYDNATPSAISALLRDLSARGIITPVANNTWDVALKDGAWARLLWYPDWNALEVTVSDREVHRVDDQTPYGRYDAILSRIAQGLRQHGVTAVGTAVGFAKSVDLVGLTLYHSVGDRAEAVKQMAIDWTALYQAMATQVGELTIDPWGGNHPTTQAEWDANPPDPEKVTWWKSYVKPILASWNKFKSDQLGGDRTVAADYIAFGERFETNWDVYEGWKKKLDDLRAEAEKRGFKVDLPKPAELPTTVFADAADVAKRGAGAVAEAASDTWKIAKYGAWAALGLGTLVILGSVISNVRKGKDPVETYGKLARGS